MHLSEHSLRQLDRAYLDALDEAALRGLSAKLLDDLKEARDRLNQGPSNSSRPPSSRAPWERKGGAWESDASPDVDADAAEGDLEPKPAEVKPAGTQAAETTPAKAPPARKPGKQPGAPGIGRTQVFQAHAERPHYPAVCAGCGRPPDPAVAVAYTGFQAVEFAHHGADDDHGGLAGGGESIPEGPTPSGLVQSDHGRHVQRLAQAGVSHFREARFAMHATPRLVLARVEAGEGGGLAGVIEPLWPAVERQEDRDGFVPQAGDGIEQVTLVLDRRIIVDPSADGGLDLGDNAIQMGDQGLNAGAHAGVGHRQPGRSGTAR